MEWNLINLPAIDLEKEFYMFILLQQFASFHTHSFYVPYIFIHLLLYVLLINSQNFTERGKIQWLQIIFLFKEFCSFYLFYQVYIVSMFLFSLVFFIFFSKYLTNVLNKKLKDVVIMIYF